MTVKSNNPETMVLHAGPRSDHHPLVRAEHDRTLQ